MIHLYYGDGKGKTSAAIGLVLRMSGAGKTTVFSQFFKDGSSSEISVLRSVPGVAVMHCNTAGGWLSDMTEAERERAFRDYREFFAEVVRASKGVDLLVLDEIVFAVNSGAVPLEDVTAFLKSVPEDREVALTGRDPAPELIALADYATKMDSIKHPFDRGIKARLGVEL